MEVPWKNGSLWSAPFWDPAKYNLHAKMAYMILQYDTMIRDEWYDMIQNMPWHFCWSNYNNSKPTLVVTCPGLGKSSDVFEFPAPIWSVGCDRAGCALDETRMNENSWSWAHRVSIHHGFNIFNNLSFNIPLFQSKFPLSSSLFLGFRLQTPGWVCAITPAA
jgi:hypothetical protein